MEKVNTITSMYSGKAENETYYSSTTSAVSGSYYEHIKEEVSIWLDKIIQRQDQREQIVIADYGTADGVGVLSMLNILLGSRLQGMNGVDIMIYLNDQPSNDFNLLINGIKGPATSRLKSGQVLSENVSVAVIARSMFERCLPRNSLDICFSTTAVHWLSQKPCDITNGLMYKQANEKEDKAFYEQAKQDWHNFLVSRGKELKKGGLCVVLCPKDFPEDDDDTHPHELVEQSWKRLLDSGMITKEEFVNTTVQVYIRRADDLTYPFNHDDQEIITLGLRLLFSKRIIHKYSEMMKNYSETSKKHKERYADAVVGLMKPWLRNTIYSSLSNERPAISRNKICDDFFQNMWEMAYRKEVKFTHHPFLLLIIQKM